MRMIQKIMLLAILLSAIPVWAGNLTVDNLTVASNAAVYGHMDFYIGSYVSNNGATATGGTITMNANYRIHTFTNNGTFAVSNGSLNCDVLIVAGGGGGGGNSGGGGGGGGVIITNIIVSAGSTNVTVGNGGVGGTPNSKGTNGTNSVFGSLVAYGGGGGYSYNGQNGLPGGCGGGAGAQNGGGTGGAGTNGQGFAGGNSGNGNGASAGGGGAATVGSNYVSDTVAGNGGDGKSSSISGTPTQYGGGGGGGGNESGTAGTGGAGGGGNGSVTAVGSNGVANTGGGGGGGGYGGSPAGGNGGSGIVIVRYLFSSTNVTMSVSSNGINQTSTSISNIFMGKVGIGTANPTQQLHVVGNVQVDGTIVGSGLTLGTNATVTNWPSVGALIASSNLSDLVNVATARYYLGLGTIATCSSNAFITTTNGNGAYLTNITFTQIGGTLSTNAGALLKANNLSELTASASTARTNLGLASAATHNAGDFLTPTGNGSQLTGITAAQVGALTPTGNGSQLTNITAAQVGALTPTGDGSQLTNITAAQVGALSTTGGVVSGSLDIQYIPPKGDLIMGAYTNQ